MANQVLRNQLFQHFRDAGKVRLVILKFDSVDQSCQLKDFLPGAFVVTTEVFRKFLNKEIPSEYGNSIGHYMDKVFVSLCDAFGLIHDPVYTSVWVSFATNLNVCVTHADKG